MIACLAIPILSVLVALTLYLAFNWDHTDTCPDEQTLRIQEEREKAIRQIDEKADYYLRLYAYIEERVGDEIGRRQSNPQSGRRPSGESGLPYES